MVPGVTRSDSICGITFVGCDMRNTGCTIGLTGLEGGRLEGF